MAAKKSSSTKESKLTGIEEESPYPVVSFTSHDWGRRYCGNQAGLWEAGVIGSSDDLPPRSWRRKPWTAHAPDGRKIQIRRNSEGTFEAEWPYREGEKHLLPANHDLLVRLADRSSGIGSLVQFAGLWIRRKSYEKDWELEGSSKLGRALDDLEYAANDLKTLMKTIRGLIAPDENDDDEGDDSNGDDNPVLPSGPPPSKVTP